MTDRAEIEQKLRERTLGQLESLLEGWVNTVVTIEAIPFVFLRNGRYGFAATGASQIDALISAAALAVAAGELHLATTGDGEAPIITVRRCAASITDTEGVQRCCFRAEGHEGDHEDSLGRWYEGGSSCVIAIRT
jgi:hypothetical protein